MSPKDSTLMIELTGTLEIDAADRLETEVEDELVDIAFASGLGAERALKLVSGIAKPAINELKRLVLHAFQANRITGVKITKDSVEIDAMRAEDVDTLRTFINDVLDRLDEC